MTSALCSRLLMLVFSIAVVVVSSSGQTPPKDASAKPGATATPTIKFEKYTLPNGLVVILSEDHRLPLVSPTFGTTWARRMRSQDAPDSLTCSNT